MPSGTDAGRPEGMGGSESPGVSPDADSCSLLMGRLP